MRTTHTPGPWQALPEEVDKPYIRIRGTRLGGRYKVANVVHPEGAFNTDETRANARLIAAAPQLLAACQAVDTFFVFFDSWTPPHLGSGAREALQQVKAALRAASTPQPPAPPTINP